MALGLGSATMRAMLVGLGKMGYKRKIPNGSYACERGEVLAGPALQALVGPRHHDLVVYLFSFFPQQIVTSN